MRRLVLLLALAGCQRCGPHGSADATSSTTASAGDASIEMMIEGLLPKELADTPPFGNDDKRAVCGKTITGTCDILQETSAGKDALGRDLVVVTVRTREPFDSGPGDWDSDNGVEDREHWVIARKDGNIVFRAPIASELARTEVGVESSLKVGPNELQLDKADVAPSSWNWMPSFTFRLSPPTLLVFADSMFNSNPEMVGTSGTKIDLRDGSGEGFFHCTARGGKYFPVPVLARQAIDPARGLGRCAGDIDGTPQHGYVLKGTADKQNGWFRVAYLGSFIVEVHDDKFTPGDRLEVRVGRSASGMGCDFFRTVVRRITIDGTGVVSQSGLIEAKRIRNEANVRTFEISFANPKELDVWSGFAIDMIDDDGSAVRKLSTAGIGPELGSVPQIDEGACMGGPDGPVAVPLVRTEASAAASATATGAIASIVRAWNDATNAHDAAKLSALYAEDVELYGTKMTRVKATAIKNAAFATHDHDTLYDISVTKNRATFRKNSRLKNTTTIWVDGYIDVDASMRITAEGDTTTDENLALKKERDCLAAIEALLTSTPEGKKAATHARRGVDHDGPRWSVRYFSSRPGSKEEDDDLVTSDEFEIDAIAATIQHDGKPMAVAMSKVTSACK